MVGRNLWWVWKWREVSDNFHSYFRDESDSETIDSVAPNELPRWFS